jgi:hypothetical protein
MSALGQKQTGAVQKRMSALSPIATAKADSRNAPQREGLFSRFRLGEFFFKLVDPILQCQ